MLGSRLRCASSQMYKDFRSIYVNLGGNPSKKALMEFVKKHRVPVRKLERLCNSYNVSCRFHRETTDGNPRKTPAN